MQKNEKFACDFNFIAIIAFIGIYKLKFITNITKFMADCVSIAKYALAMRLLNRKNPGRL